MKIVQADGFEFRFDNALDAFIFDEKDPAKHTFHGAPMKCVDIIVELEDNYIYIELKNYDDQASYDINYISDDSSQSVQNYIVNVRRTHGKSKLHSFDKAAYETSDKNCFPLDFKSKWKQYPKWDKENNISRQIFNKPQGRKSPYHLKRSFKGDNIIFPAS